MKCTFIQKFDDLKKVVNTLIIKGKLKVDDRTFSQLVKNTCLYFWKTVII